MMSPLDDFLKISSSSLEQGEKAHDESSKTATNHVLTSTAVCVHDFLSTKYGKILQGALSNVSENLNEDRHEDNTLLDPLINCFAPLDQRLSSSSTGQQQQNAVHAHMHYGASLPLFLFLLIIQNEDFGLTA